MKNSKRRGALVEDDASDDFAPELEANKAKGDKGGKSDEKQSNTIIQQINGFSMTPMNDKIAEQTIEDHKYLLELVENRAAIAYFACANRNQSLFMALRNYIKGEIQAEKDEEEAEQKDKKKKKRAKNKHEAESMFMEATFKKMILDFDFMSLVMYPELKNRREFVHDAWYIAKLTENTELKIAISNDPYFFITREDILQLLKTKDDTMIQHMLRNEIMLHINEDVSYKLVKIKNGQVNANQQTIVQLVDFISVLVLNKRDGKYGDGQIIFPHGHIVEFMETHSEFLEPVSAIKVFIMSRKFRLSLQYLISTGVEFEIEFFTFALEANAYDIVFYLRQRFEEQVFQHAGRAIEAHVQTYQNTPKFLKAKLHLSKSLLPIFNFNGVKQYLAIMQLKIFDHTLENNIFSHSSNPLLAMCLLYEFLFLLTKRFFSLSYTCRTLQDQVKKMIIEYIESVDDENFLTSVMLEKDYTGRDSLQIAVELEVLDLIQAPKVEAVIKRIWNSDYDTSGSFFEMSTPFQILRNQTTTNDVESLNRFYKKRDIEGMPQYDSNFNIFQQSMNSRLKGMGLISIIFVIVSVIYYEQVINQALFLRPTFQSMESYKQTLLRSSEESEILETLKMVEQIEIEITDSSKKMYDAFILIMILCFFNCMFFISQLLQIVFLQKIRRTYTFPTISFFTDFIMIVMSAINISWTVETIQRNVNIAGVSEAENGQRIIANLMGNVEFKFEYIYAVIIVCLIWRILEIVQFQSEIGPLVKIVEKMLGDFLNFILLYLILILMFAIIGNINFIFELKEFKGLFVSSLTVLDASIGNYNFEIFNSIANNDFLIIFGDLYIVAVVLTFNILILNLMIAILSNTYNMFDTKSTGLYLSKILQARDDMQFDENYGALLLTMAPMNCVVLPFVPYALIAKPSPRLNTFVMILQYSVFIIVVYFAFLICSCAMIPFAFLKTLLIKAQSIMRAPSVLEKLMTLWWVLCYMVMGIPNLVFGILTDFFYFWANNFRSNLKKIIIVRKESTITNESIRFFTNFCSKYNEEKVRAIYCKDTVKTMRQKYLIKENIQYLLFGQFVGQNATSLNSAKGTNILKSTKTSNLKAYKNRIEELENTADQIAKSRYEIDQYNQIKMILLNLSYNNNGEKTLCVDIVESVMDEIRRERKTSMVLADEEIEEYIKQDLAEAEAMKKEDLTPFLRKIVLAKASFKKQLCLTVSILRLGYMYRVLQNVHPGKASMLGAEAFMYKVKKIERAANKKKTFDINQEGAKSALYNSSQGGSQDNINVGTGIGDTKNIENPMLQDIDKFVAGIKQKMLTTAVDKMKAVETLLRDAQGAPAGPKQAGNHKSQVLDTVEENLKRIESNKGY